MASAPARGTKPVTALRCVPATPSRWRDVERLFGEGYPLDPSGKRLADMFAWFGLAASFRRAGFKEVARRSNTRPLMRFTVRQPRATRATSRG